MKLVREFETRLLRRRQVQHCAAKCALLCFFLTVAMLCLGALLSMMTSHWTFLEGIYFWYISFTTVGFGDYVPPTVHGITKEPHSSEATHLLTEIALQAFYSLWFVPGLCMVASVISSIQDALEKSPYQGACFGCLATNSYGVGEALRRDVGPTGSFSFTEQQVNGAFELVDLSKLEDGFNTKMWCAASHARTYDHEQSSMHAEKTRTHERRYSRTGTRTRTHGTTNAHTRGVAHLRTRALLDAHTRMRTLEDCRTCERALS